MKSATIALWAAHSNASQTLTLYGIFLRREPAMAGRRRRSSNMTLCIDQQSMGVANTLAEFKLDMTVARLPL